MEESFKRIETIVDNEVSEFSKTLIEGNLNQIKRYLENLIARNKELEEDNVILKKASGIAKDVKIEDVTKFVNKSVGEFINDYLPKSKVREKIEKLKNEIKENRNIASRTADRVEARILNDQINELYKAIKILEELLQEGDK